MTAIPTPAFLAAKPRPDLAAKQQVAKIEPELPSGRMTLGDTEVVSLLHDGVVKTKHLKPGMEVQPFVKGEPRGALRTVATVERLGDGEFWHVTFSTPHPEWDYKAAYRWYVPALKDTEVKHTVRRLVPYQES